MYINSDSEDFSPTDFVILNFYGTDTCFAWDEDKFISFPYSYKDSTEKLQIRNAPTKIKDIRGFDGRIFILCSPSGIYKLTDSYEFANLSKSGIELGSDFCEVLTPTNGILILEDKKLKSTEKLFSFSSTIDIHVLALEYKSIDKSLLKLLLPNKHNNKSNLCFVVHEKNIFKMIDKTIQIIYSCDYTLKKIKSIEKNQKAIGAIVETDTNVVILIHVSDNKLKFEKIFLESNVEAMCAVVESDNENSLLIIHSDGAKTYYTRRLLNGDSINRTSTEDNSYKSIKLYQSKFLVYLNSFKELFQAHIDQIKDPCSQNKSNYVRLEPNMLRGLEEIREAICCKAMELKTLKEEVVEKEKQLQMINLFVTKQHLKYCPQDTVTRLLDHVILISNFQRALPKNSIVVKILKSREKSTFSMKKVNNFDTCVQMPVDVSNLSANLYTTTDLITHKKDGEIWCLIKNYVRDPPASKSNKIHLPVEKCNFVKHKLLVLQDLMENNKVNMETLSQLKQEVRQYMLCS